jgi:hypothetical protein
MMKQRYEQRATIFHRRTSRCRHPRRLFPALGHVVVPGRRGGLRGNLPREPGALPATRSAQPGRKHRQHVQRSLEESDYLQAAEKSWGAFTQIVKAIGADHQIKLSSHVGIYRVAGELASLMGQLDPDAEIALNNATALVSSLHTHFYENNLTDPVVIHSAAMVSDGIDLLQEYFPPPTER